MTARLALITAIIVLPLGLTALLGCTNMSERRVDAAAGFNGSFEFVADDLPVNWLIYSPRTVPDAHFTVTLDDTVVHQGTHALRFDVESCTERGGWQSPGIATEQPAQRGGTYRIRGHVRSIDSRWVIRFGGVAAKTGACSIIAEGSDTNDAWHTVDTLVTIAESHPILRFEMNVLSPGTLWIDDIGIERVEE